MDIEKLASDTAVLERAGEDERDACVKELRATGRAGTVRAVSSGRRQRS
ncbi:hypothetical protein ABZZ36_36860 [Actinacidiphila glaucinigra]